MQWPEEKNFEARPLAAAEPRDLASFGKSLGFSRSMHVIPKEFSDKKPSSFSQVRQLRVGVIQSSEGQSLPPGIIHLPGMETLQKLGKVLARGQD